MKSLEKAAYRYLLFAVGIVIAAGTIFYHFAEKFSWLDAYYFSITTLSTVGYGDLAPKTSLGKFFTTFYVVLGIGIFSTFVTITVRRRGETIKKRRKI